MKGQDTSLGTLLERYRDRPPEQHPWFLRLVRENSQEARAVLQELDQAPEPVAREWRSRIFYGTDRQAQDAVFEMRLFSWLKQVGKVEIDTSPRGSRVDFLLYPHDDPKAGPIELEAFVVHPSEEEEAFWRFFRGLEQLIRETDPPVCCTLELDWVREGGLEKEPPVYRRAQLRRVLHNFLAHPRGDDVLVFRAAWEKRWVVRITVVALRRREDCAGSPVRFGGPGRAAWATPLPVYRAMKRKMKQHKARKGRRPLVLAVGLYRWEMGQEEVIQALFGNHLLSFREDLDLSLPRPLDLYFLSTQAAIFPQAKFPGLLFHTRTHLPVHRSLSGVLVFPIGDVPVLPATGRAGMYIENPMARFPVDPNLWPVCQRFVEVRSVPVSKEGYLLMARQVVSGWPCPG